MKRTALYYLILVPIFYFNFSESVLDSGLIPRKKSWEDYCPYGKPTEFGLGKYRCYCEDHCSWEICRLYEAPDECLIGTDSAWLWDSPKRIWVAQMLRGIIH